MKGRRPEDVIGEWGIRDVTPPSQQERRALEGELDLNPLAGKPLRRRLRNFVAEPDTYLASLGGPLPYMRRLREIDARPTVTSPRSPPPTRNTAATPTPGGSLPSAGTSARSTS